MVNGGKEEKINKMIICFLLVLCLITLSVIFLLGILVYSFNAGSGTLEQRTHKSVQEQIKSEQLIR